MMAMILGVHKIKDKNHTLHKVLSKNKRVEAVDYFIKFPFAKELKVNDKKSLVVHAGFFLHGAFKISMLPTKSYVSH